MPYKKISTKLAMRQGENGERSASLSYVFYHNFPSLSRAFFNFFNIYFSRRQSLSAINRNRLQKNKIVFFVLYDTMYDILHKACEFKPK